MARRVILILMLMFALAVPVAYAQEDCGAQYTVQPGDNLTRIAAICGTTVEALRDANPDVISLIRPGDVLNIVSEQGGGGGAVVVAITPAGGPIGTQVTAVANGFPANVPVQVGLGQSGQTALITANAASDVNGGVTVRLGVPNVAVGTQLVVTIRTNDGTVSATSAPFTVSGTPFGTGGVGGGPNAAVEAALPAIPAPIGVNVSGAVFNRVNVYMVAPSGSGGVTTTCGDSIVPVQIAVNQTVAPLRASLNALLGFTAAEYGLTNLDNPLSRTNLTIDEILIIDGEAVITLNGTLASTSACADAQLRGQIEATALQYATVDRVTVFVNGVPLDNILR